MPRTTHTYPTPHDLPPSPCQSNFFLQQPSPPPPYSASVLRNLYREPLLFQLSAPLEAGPAVVFSNAAHSLVFGSSYAATLASVPCPTTTHPPTPRRRRTMRPAHPSRPRFRPTPHTRLAVARPPQTPRDARPAVGIVPGQRPPRPSLRPSRAPCFTPPSCFAASHSLISLPCAPQPARSLQGHSSARQAPVTSCPLVILLDTPLRPHIPPP